MSWELNPGFLPSSFSMYAMSLASAFALSERPALVVAVAASGVIIGWPFSVLAFVPVTLFSLHCSLKQAFLSGAITSIALLVSHPPPKNKKRIGGCWSSAGLDSL